MKGWVVAVFTSPTETVKNKYKLMKIVQGKSQTTTKGLHKNVWEAARFACHPIPLFRAAQPWEGPWQSDVSTRRKPRESQRASLPWTIAAFTTKYPQSSPLHLLPGAEPDATVRTLPDARP